MPNATKSNQELARTFCESKKGILIWERQTQMFWRYDGRIWSPFEMIDMTTDLNDFIDSVDEANRLTTGKLEDIARQCRFYSKNIRQLDDRWLSFNDTLLDTDTFELAAHAPERIATVHVDYNYAELMKAECPLFDRYLEMVCTDSAGLPNPGMRTQLMEMLGYALSPENAEKCFILYGTGANGKSVFLELLRMLVTDERCHAATISELTTQGFQLSGLIGKRVNAVDEDESMDGKTSTLKRIVSGNPITTRRLYGETFTFRPQTKFYFGSNDLPRMDGFGDAVMRRFLLVPFERKISREEKILRLAWRIERNGELPAIVFRALEALKNLKERNYEFTETEQSREAMAEFEASSSSVSDYLRNSWKHDSDGKVSCMEIYRLYAQWAKDTGHRAKASNGFGRIAKSILGPSKTMRIGGVLMRGYEATPSGESPSEPQPLPDL